MQATLKRIPPVGQLSQPDAEPPASTPSVPDDSSATSETQAFDAAQAVVASYDQLSRQVAQLGKQLRQAQKLASLGTMSAMLAHEFNNLLTPIVSYSQYALRKNDPDLIRSAAERAFTQATRVVELCERILGLAAGDEQQIAPVNLARLIDDSLKCLGRDLAKDNITVAVEIDPTLAIAANANLMQQVFFNLILNARQAMLGRPGRLTITAKPQGSAVTVAVADTGAGIKPDDLTRIFEPFFSTKRNADRPDKGGVGLGLAVCRDIVQEQIGRASCRERV